jgi:hypothetical protein
MPETNGVTGNETPQQVDLRPRGQMSEAVVKAIMEKWRLTVQHQDEVPQQTQYYSYRPEFIQSTRRR